jgi:serine/threonine protein kinase
VVFLAPPAGLSPDDTLGRRALAPLCAILFSMEAFSGAQAPDEGDTIGPFLVGALLGEGAAGTVFRAVHLEDRQEVALKVMKRALTADTTYLRRFRREALIASEVRHRNLVPVLEFGEDAGVLFIATEFRDGGSLADLIAERSQLPLPQCTRLTADIAAGLGALHQHGIVHRDVKPANVMLDHSGSAAVTDFGLAQGHAYTVLTKPGQVLGTIDYLAPELIQGSEATPASDVYALGCLVYECVTGAAPFSQKALFEVAMAHLQEDPPDPRERRSDVPEEYTWALLRALAKDAEQRPPTAMSFARLLSVSTPARGRSTSTD